MSAKAIHAVIASYAGFNGLAYPSQRTIGESLGLSERQVRRGICELEGAGLIVRNHGQGLKSARYSVAPFEGPALQKPSAFFDEDTGQGCPVERSVMSGGSGHKCPVDRTRMTGKADMDVRLLEEENRSFLEGEAAALSELAANFFETYPKRTELHLAESYFAGYSLDDAKAAIEGLKRWLGSKEWQREGGQFIPSAAKFLAQKRWKDFPDQAHTTDETPLFDEAMA